MIHDKPLSIYNSLTRQKEIFVPLTPERIGMYVCGPTVYNDVHLGNCRTFVNFDIIYRFLLHLGYKIRYVRNITDVGHLLDDGEDRMAKGARLEQLEPMEVAQKYTVGFHDMMRILGTLPPSIEPRATGHIPEQIEMVQTILDNGLAYVAHGSVYFDVQKLLADDKGYGALSGRVVEDLLQESRELKGQEEKRHPADFAIWMKATEAHIMRWNSPWSVGFPGWHLECSAMSTKYLGTTFDIHGGGGDLKFPHHENEIAQNIGACNCQPANYWMHANMLLLNGKKMSKSDGNTISPTALFSGESDLISKGYAPAVVRFFFLQAHYRSTLDITDEALQSAEKGYFRLMDAKKLANTLPAVSGLGAQDETVLALLEGAMQDMLDDFNAPKAMGRFFELATIVNAISNAQLSANSLSEGVKSRLIKDFNDFLFEIMGLWDDTAASASSSLVLDKVMELVLEMRQSARTRKDWSESDRIRDGLSLAGIQVEDGKAGVSWELLR